MAALTVDTPSGQVEVVLREGPAGWFTHPGVYLLRTRQGRYVGATRRTILERISEHLTATHIGAVQDDINEGKLIVEWLSGDPQEEAQWIHRRRPELNVEHTRRKPIRGCARCAPYTNRRRRR